MKLRSYQHDLHSHTLSLFDRSVRRVLLQLPTGAGKTIIFTSIADHYLKQGIPVLVIAHRRELLQQAKAKLEAFTGRKVGVVQGNVKPNYSLPIQVGSIQTLVNRLDRVGKFGLIITDEAHHCSSSTYRKVLGHFSEAHHLGVTATPKRLDGKGLNDLYDHLVCGPTVEQLINDGFLADFKLFAADQAMRTGRKVCGEYSAKDVAARNNAIELSGRLIDSYQQHCPGAKTIIFAVNCEHSRQIVEQYNAAGIPSAHLDAKSSDTERVDTLQAFADGRIRVLSNVSLFDEGFDCPDVEAVQIARPTASLTKHLQMMGRALRPAAGKKYAILLDHTSNWKTHGTPRRRHSWSLEGNPKSKDVRITRRGRDGRVVEIERPKIIERRVTLSQISENATSDIFDFASHAPNPKSAPPLRQDYASLPGLWACVVEQLRPMGTQVLFRQHGRVLGFIRGKLTVVVVIKNEKLLKMASDRVQNLRAGFRSVLGTDVEVLIATQEQHSSLRSAIDQNFLPLPVRQPVPVACPHRVTTLATP